MNEKEHDLSMLTDEELHSAVAISYDCLFFSRNFD